MVNGWTITQHKDTIEIRLTRDRVIAFEFINMLPEDAEKLALQIQKQVNKAREWRERNDK